MLVASISGQVEEAFKVFFAWLPNLVGALVVLLLGYIVAKVVGGLVAKATGRAGLDRSLHSGPGGNYVSKVTSSPSRLLGTVVFWLIFLGAISLAASVLGIAALTAFVGAVWAYVPNLIAAFLIFLVASALAAGLSALVSRTIGDTPLGRIAGTAAPILIMAIATFMILDQLKIAPAIVTITYAALMGSIALGAALAFGLGGRSVAERMLEGAYASGQRNKEQMKLDWQRGREQAKEQVQEARDNADSGDGAQTRVQERDAEAELRARAAMARGTDYEQATEPAFEPEDSTTRRTP
jgi:hypothetical protein